MNLRPSISLLMGACTACSSVSEEEVVLSKEPSEAEMAFATFTDSIPADTLPYVLDEVDYIRYSDFRPVGATGAAQLLGSSEASARYYIVSKPLVTDSFIALIILESLIDTAFTTQEDFQLLTYDLKGRIIGRCPIGQASYDENFFKSVGSIGLPDKGQWPVTVETYMSEMVDGEWRQISFPVEVKSYAIDGRGRIRHVKTTTNSLEGEPVDVS